MGNLGGRFSMVSEQDIACPACGSHHVDERWEEERFEYGTNGSAVELNAVVPVCRCRNCALQFTDERAEKARHASVCEHLGILTPDEILAIRERHGLTQQDFAVASGIGRASLARWESASIFQNTSTDNLLFLLAFPENLVRLKKRREQPSQSNVPASAEVRRFQALDENDTHQLAREAASFRLYLND